MKDSSGTRLARYFFDFDDGEKFVTDDEGTVFAEAREACAEAWSALTRIVAEVEPSGRNAAFAATVREASGSVLYRVDLTIRERFMRGPTRGFLENVDRD